MDIKLYSSTDRKDAHSQASRQSTSTIKRDVCGHREYDNVFRYWNCNMAYLSSSSRPDYQQKFPVTQLATFELRRRVIVALNIHFNYTDISILPPDTASPAGISELHRSGGGPCTVWVRPVLRIAKSGRHTGPWRKRPFWIHISQRQFVHSPRRNSHCLSPLPDTPRNQTLLPVIAGCQSSLPVCVFGILRQWACLHRREQSCVPPAGIFRRQYAVCPLLP